MTNELEVQFLFLESVLIHYYLCNISMADLLDKEACFHWSLAFKKSGHSLVCDLCRDPVLGPRLRDLASVRLILEAVR